MCNYLDTDGYRHIDTALDTMNGKTEKMTTRLSILSHIHKSAFYSKGGPGVNLRGILQRVTDADDWFIGFLFGPF